VLTSTQKLLSRARSEGYAVGAFNVYNLEGVQAVMLAAEEAKSPVIVQLHPQAIKNGRSPLVALCLEAARVTPIPVAVHLDHASHQDDIRQALNWGMSSIMADGSHLAYEENISFTRQISTLVHDKGGFVEAELGRISGTEDGIIVDDLEARMTDPFQAREFVARTQVDALAVCIGNVHGHYPGEIHLDFDRLERISHSLNLPLVLHGASGLPEEDHHHCIELGICKFNVNTEIREAYLSSLIVGLQSDPRSDLLQLMKKTVNAMRDVVMQKIFLFGSQSKLD